jgi:hypothetical protein
MNNHTLARLVLLLACFVVTPSWTVAKNDLPVFPTPQFYQLLEGEVILKKGLAEVAFVLPSRIEPSIEVATKLISGRLQDLELEVKASQIRLSQAIAHNAFRFFLLPFSQVPELGNESILVEADRHL